MKTTEEKNRMIAEFMGVNKNDNGTFELPQFGSLRPNGDFKTEFEINQLKYHTSWEWLMPVVEKIEGIGYWFTYLKPNSTNVTCIIGKLTDNSVTPWKYSEFIEVTGGLKKQVTYNAVVQFIEWYNEQKL